MEAIIKTAALPQFADAYCFATVMCGTPWKTKFEAEQSLESIPNPMGLASSQQFKKYNIFRKCAPLPDLSRILTCFSCMHPIV